MWISTRAVPQSPRFRVFRKAILIGIAVFAAGLASAQSPTETIIGSAYIKTDADHRVVVTIDRDPADGTTDDVFILDPIIPLAGGLTPMSRAVIIDIYSGRITVHATSGDLDLDLSVPEEPIPPNQAITLLPAGGIVMKGVALLHRTSATWVEGPASIDTDIFQTIMLPAGPGSTGPNNLVCDGGKVTEDTKCTRGGVGSTQTSVGCGGMVGITGETGSTTCGPGRYDCGYCVGPVAFAICKSENCVCPIPLIRCGIRQD